MGSATDASMAQAADSFVMDGSSIQLSQKKAVEMGGTTDGGLDGTYEQKAGARRSDFLDDAKALKKEDDFAAKFDSYVGVFGILFVGAFIAPMVTYFWYVRDEDPWEN